MNQPASKPTHKPVARSVGAVASGVMAGERGRKSVAPRKAAEVIAALTEDQRTAVEGVINRLFREIRDVRPAWRQAWPTKQAMESSKIKWLAALIEARCTDWEGQIEVGLARLRAEPSDFVPSPGSFVAWCVPTPEALGVPPVDRAFAEACRNAHTAARQGAKWSHPVVYHAAIDVGLDVLMYEPTAHSRKLFDRSFAVMMRRAAMREPLGGAVALGIGHDGSKSLAELAEEHSLQQALKLREAQGIKDNGIGARAELLKARARMGGRRV